MLARRRLHPWLWLGLLGATAFIYRRVFAGEVIAGRDVFRLFIPNAAFLRQSLLAGRLPLWNPYIRLGEPFVATLQSQAFYPPNVLAVLLVGPTWTPTVLQLFNVLLGSVGMFLACRRFGRSKGASAVGAAVIALTPFFAQTSLVPNIAGAIAWGGFILVGAQAIARRPGLRSAVFLALPLGLSALCGAPEVTLCEGLIALAVVGRSPRSLLTAFLGCLWAVALALVSLLPTAELALNSTRGFHRATLSWSTSLPQLLSVVLPFADLPRKEYWGSDQVLFVSLFLGTTTGLLALLAVRTERRRRVLALLAAGFALLALGAHFPPARFLLTHPPFGIFRYPAKFLAGTALCLAPLAAFGLDRLGALARRVGPNVRRAPLLLGAWFALFALGFWGLHHLPVRFGLALAFAWGMGVLLVLALGFLLVRPGAARPRHVRTVAVGLLCVELFAFALDFPVASWATAAAFDHPSSLAAALRPLADGRISVVLPEVPVAEDVAKSRHYLESARDGLVPVQVIRERMPTVEGYGTPEPARLDDLEQGAPQPLYNLLGVRGYVRDGPAPFPGLRPVGEVPGVARAFLGGAPMPRAFVVYRTQPVDEAGAMRAVLDPKEPFRATAFLEDGQAPRGPVKGCQGFTPAITREGFGRTEIDLTACGPGELVLTDRAYPGWEATLDGRPVPISRADWLVRGVAVPAGAHQVVMRYRPWSFRVGALLSLLALLAAVVALVRTRTRSAA